MSEYQFYHFLAIDRPLTAKQMAVLRTFSTRARITPSTFVNDYSWGNFRGNSGGDYSGCHEVTTLRQGSVRATRRGDHDWVRNP